MNNFNLINLKILLIENMCAKTKASDYYFYIDDSQPWSYPLFKKKTPAFRQE